jgi:hypothetical protein
MLAVIAGTCKIVAHMLGGEAAADALRRRSGWAVPIGLGAAAGLLLAG